MSRHDQIGTHKTVVYTENGFTKVKYHYTDVVEFNERYITLNSGGYRTNTTKTRINQTSNQYGLGVSVYQKNYVWYVVYRGATIPFSNHMILYR